MKIYTNPPRTSWEEILERPALNAADLFSSVAEIMEKVKTGGDNALKFFSEKFDNAKLSQFSVPGQEIEEAENLVSEDLKKAIQVASKNIEVFHDSQHDEKKVVETSPGVRCWRRSKAIDKVGLYVPGGTAPLLSTVLMLAIPARLAGCKQIIMCSPPGKDGKIHPAILYAAKLSGVTNIYKIGGAQAVAAMAYGTETVPKVYKIFGPGNQYVTAAKMYVNAQGTAIDMPAGPSEVMVVADETSKPAYIAADLLSQAEHGADSQVVLVADTEAVITKVMEQVDIQLKQLPRKEFAQKALGHSVAIVLNKREDVIDIINEYAPEHLILSNDDPYSWEDKIQNAGSVFIGNYTPEAAGDYASGTNHTLPTSGFAKAYSGVSLDSYIKKITFQEITTSGLKKLGPVIETMAAAELLDAHKNAVSIRLADL